MPLWQPAQLCLNTRVILILCVFSRRINTVSQSVSHLTIILTSLFHALQHYPATITDHTPAHDLGEQVLGPRERAVGRQQDVDVVRVEFARAVVGHGGHEARQSAGPDHPQLLQPPLQVRAPVIGRRRRRARPCAHLHEHLYRTHTADDPLHQNPERPTDSYRHRRQELRSGWPTCMEQSAALSLIHI